MAIYFRYSNTPLTSLVFDSSASIAIPPAEPTQKKFHGVKVTDPMPNTTIDNGRALNGAGYAHILNSFEEMTVIISANEIDTFALDLLKKIWVAPFKYISIDGGNYKEILLAGGAFPLTYIEEVKYLPEITFNISFVEPTTWQI